VRPMDDKYLSECEQITGNSPSPVSLGFDGEKYRRASAHQKEWGTRIIEELELTGWERVLDLGCGDGELTARLASLVPEGFVVGVDSAPSMISAAARHRHINLKFELLDMSQLETEGEFDVVFSNSALHWIKDQENLLRRVAKALKPGAVLRFNFPAEGNCATFNRTVQEVMGRYAGCFDDFEWPWYMPTPEDYLALAGRFGFQDLRVWGENADRFFPDAEALIGWIDQPCLVPFLPWVPELERQPFRAEVIERMLRSTRRADGRCFEQFRRVHVFARK
jgi:trans-aconitate 2-methyltransferase